MELDKSWRTPTQQGRGITADEFVREYESKKQATEAWRVSMRPTCTLAHCGCEVLPDGDLQFYRPLDGSVGIFRRADIHLLVRWLKDTYPSEFAQALQEKSA